LGLEKVAIVMGSDSDLPVMKDAAKILDKFSIGYRIYISSAHRVPDKTAQIAQTAGEKGIEVIIAGAGGAAHLPGVLAALTSLPVIGVPIRSGALNGVDSLYSIVQMPSGIPVATVSINGAKNAGILAAQILGLKYPEIAQKLVQFRKELADQVEAKDEKLQKIGVDAYLNEM
jgi:5-(carboxyamino)imidazole ribonucleotide mutase